MAEKYANLFSTSLSASTDDTQTSIDVAAAAPTALHSGQFRIKVGGELMLVTSGQDTTTWTVTRGVESTTAAAHSAGLSVQHYLTAGALGNIVAEGAVLPVAQSYYAWALDTYSSAGTWLDWTDATVTGDDFTDTTGSTTFPAFTDAAATYHIAVCVQFADSDATKYAYVELAGDNYALKATTVQQGPGVVASVNLGGFFLGADHPGLKLRSDYGDPFNATVNTIVITKFG